jgi:hypothetical protein
MKSERQEIKLALAAAGIMALLVGIVLAQEPTSRRPLEPPDASSPQETVNGWVLSSLVGDRAFYGGNWLPAPNGPIHMVIRLFWSKTEASSILPPGSGSGAWKPPAINVAQ